MTKKLAVVIGRFTIPHNGHFHLIEEALKVADEVLIILGSANVSPSIKNPFSAHTRSRFIEAHAIREGYFDRIHYGEVEDFIYNDDLWASKVQAQVSEYLSHFNRKNTPYEVTLVGHSKDESSFYLKMFPQWAFVEVPAFLQEGHVLHATILRESLFGSLDPEYFLSHLRYSSSPAVVEEFSKWISENPEELARLKEEQSFIHNYKQQWKDSPYPPIFVTVDAVVTQSGHVLLVERKAAPGEGLWALPGGFLNQQETLENAAIRELREETKIDVPAKVLRGSIKGSRVFDHPGRSLRGRTITHAYHIELPIGELPKVKGSDDARNAFWVPLNEVLSYRYRLFEDHYDIISHFIGKAD